MTTENNADRGLAAQAVSDLTVVVRMAKTNPEARQAFMGFCNKGAPVIACAVDAEQGPVFTLAPALAMFLETEKAT